MVATDLNLTVETLKPKDDLETGLAKKVKVVVRGQGGPLGGLTCRKYHKK